MFPEKITFGKISGDMKSSTDICVEQEAWHPAQTVVKSRRRVHNRPPPPAFHHPPPGRTAPPMLRLLLVLLLAWSLPSGAEGVARRIMAATCPAPAPCSCPTSSESATPSAISCANAALAAFPRVEPNAGTFTELDLSYNEIFDFSYNDLRELPALRTLSLASNSLAGLHGSKFAETPELESLDLSKNRVPSVDAFAFLGLTRLQRLDLSAQAPGLSALADGAFRDCARLQHLQLSQNQLTGLGPRTLEGLGSLEELGLDDNALDTPAVGAFAPVPRLKTLRLRNNRITSIPEGLLDGLTQLERLELADNQITKLGTGLPLMEKITSLDLSRNGISSITSGQFSKMPNLEELRLDGNTGISAIAADAFSGMSKLRLLSLSGAGLSSAASLDLASLRTSAGVSLVELRLDGTGLDRLAPDLFAGLDHLRRVSLARNSFPALTKANMTGLEKLEYLDLSECGVTSLAEGTFDAMSELRALLLSGNSIGPALSQYSLSGLGRLVSLRLDNNDISCLRDQTFNGMKLGRLDLQGNNISALSRHSLQGLSMSLPADCGDYCICCQLDLSENPLSRVTAQALATVQWSPLAGHVKSLLLTRSPSTPLLPGAGLAWARGVFDAPSESGVAVALAGVTGLPCDLADGLSGVVLQACNETGVAGEVADEAEYCGIRPGVTDAPLRAAAAGPGSDDTLWIIVGLILVLPVIFLVAVVIHCAKWYRKNRGKEGLLSETPYPLGASQRPSTAETERMRASIYSATPETNPPGATLPGHVATISAIMRGMERWRRGKKTHPGAAPADEEVVIDENSLPEFAAKFRQSLVDSPSTSADSGTVCEELPSRSPSAARRVPASRPHENTESADAVSNGQQIGPGGGVGFRRASAVSLAQRGTTITPHGDLDESEERMTPAFTWRVRRS